MKNLQNYQVTSLNEIEQRVIVGGRWSVKIFGMGYDSKTGWDFIPSLTVLEVKLWF